MKTYRIIEAPSTEKLTQEVVKALSEGWQLEGGVSSTPSPQSIYKASSVFIQAMTKEDVAEEKKAVKK